MPCVHLFCPSAFRGESDRTKTLITPSPFLALFSQTTGRVAMLAVLGVLVQELYQWNDNFPSKNFLEALKTAPPLGLLQLFVFLGAYDVTTSKFEGRVPGDIGFDPLRLSADGLRENWQLSELKHGRLAMIAFLAFVVQASISDKPILEQTFEWAKSFA